MFGVGVSSGAKVEFSAINIKKVEPTPIVPSLPYKPNFSVRKFLGDRDWVFDGDEPILQLHYEKDPSCFAKLRPGYKPQLNFDSHWGLENQGAFNDAASKWTAPNVSGGGDTIKVNWSSRNVKDRFVTKSNLIVGYDTVRKTYTYDIDSELEVLPGQPFHFRYGFDFEHHTPLDPFRWQYLIAKKKMVTFTIGLFTLLIPARRMISKLIMAFVFGMVGMAKPCMLRHRWNIQSNLIGTALGRILPSKPNAN